MNAERNKETLQKGKQKTESKIKLYSFCVAERERGRDGLVCGNSQRGKKLENEEDTHTEAKFL